MENQRVLPTRIRPDRGLAQLDWRELWEYRELLFILVWRDVKVRYKQTLLGAAWAILQPLGAMLVFTFFLGKLARVPWRAGPDCQRLCHRPDQHGQIAAHRGAGCGA